MKRGVARRILALVGAVCVVGWSLAQGVVREMVSTEGPNRVLAPVAGTVAATVTDALFTGLEAPTVEAWLKWTKSDSDFPLFHFKHSGRVVGVGIRGREPDLEFAEGAPETEAQGARRFTIPGILLADGNVSKAATLLGINRTKIYRILSRAEET